MDEQCYMQRATVSQTDYGNKASTDHKNENTRRRMNPNWGLVLSLIVSQLYLPIVYAEVPSVSLVISQSGLDQVYQSINRSDQSLIHSINRSNRSGGRLRDRECESGGQRQ